jgi:hypothetical protein
MPNMPASHATNVGKVCRGLKDKKHSLTAKGVSKWKTLILNCHECNGTEKDSGYFYDNSDDDEIPPYYVKCPTCSEEGNPDSLSHCCEICSIGGMQTSPSVRRTTAAKIATHLLERKVHYVELLPHTIPDKWIVAVSVEQDVDYVGTFTGRLLESDRRWI